MARALKHFGAELVKPNSGSHWKARRGERVFPLPLHNGPKSEISEVYLRALCRALEIDEDEFRRML